MALTPSQASIVAEMFIHTADENYIAARWCYSQALYTDFFWLGTHALEKYMKAVLLHNGRSVKHYGHDVLNLYNAINSIGKKLLPQTLKKPKSLSGVVWFNRTSKGFMEFLALNGSPENRYLSYGYSVRSQDLHMLDTMVFAIRRLICPLDEPLQLLGSPHDVKPPTYRYFLTKQVDYQPLRSGPLSDLIEGRGTVERRNAALNLNVAFAPEDHVHEPARTGSAGRSPVLTRRILKELALESPVVETP
ncbi:MAG: HEPN domain-containing protein [Acidobacteriaceae bacterium]|nr:HEPN domain-containing protein [Acidobacteriaceae bacterium]